MLQPVGIEDNRSALEDMFDQWREVISADHPEATDGDWASFRSNMWDGDFMLTATRDDLASIRTPLLVMMGDDLYHPQSTSREIADHAPNATMVQRWKEDEVLDDTLATIRSFLAEHTPT
jgi:pimeloyl-ACP methyl ester carboxylesterase